MLAGNLRVRIEPELRAKLKSLATSKGLNESALMRALVMEATGGQANFDEPQMPSTEGDLQRIGTKVYLPRYVLLAGRQRAKDMGMSFTQWLGALLQSHLTQVPVLERPELQTLEGCDRQLAAIGRNLNQIARRLNTVPDGIQSKEREQFAILRAALEEQRAAIDVLIRASHNKWSVDPTL